MKCKVRSVLAGLLLTSWIGGMPLSAIANSQVIWNNNDGFGASINDIRWANVTTNLDNKIQQIQITGAKGGKITWDYLNIGKGKTLDFNFTQGGQLALNKVLTGMSKFAGTLKTSGEAGHVVISNPNGALMMKGSAINGGAGSVTLTTHEIKDFDTMDLSTGKFELESAKAADGNYYGININGAKITTIGEVNIISPGIAMQNTKVSSGGMKLISADGVNFVVDSSNNSKLALEDNSIKTFKEKNENDISPDTIIMGTGYDAKKKTDTFATIQPANIPDTAIYVNKTTFNKNKKAAGDGSTAIFATNDITLDTVKFNSDALVAVKNSLKASDNNMLDISIYNSTFNGTEKADAAGTLEDMLSSRKTGIFALSENGVNNTIYIDNSTIKNAGVVLQGQVNHLDNSLFFINKSKFTNSDIEIMGDYAYASVDNKSVLTNTNLTTKGEDSNIRLNNSTLTNTNLITKGEDSNIRLYNSILTNANLTTKGESSAIDIFKSTVKGTKSNLSQITADGKSSTIWLNNSKLSYVSLGLLGEESEMFLNGYHKDKTLLTNSKIIVGDVGDSNTAKKSKITIEGNAAKVSGTEILSYADDTKICILDSANLAKSKVAAQGVDSEITVELSTVSGSTFENPNGEIRLYDAKLTGNGKDLTLAADEIEIYHSDLNKVIAVASSSIDMEYSNVANSALGAMNAGGIVYAYDSILNKSTLFAYDPNSQIAINVSTLKGSLVATLGDISIAGATLNKTNLLTLGTGNSIMIEHSEVKGGEISVLSDNATVTIKDFSIVNGAKISIGNKPKKVKAPGGSVIAPIINNLLSSFNYTGENSAINISNATIIKKSAITAVADNSSITIEGASTEVIGSKITTGAVVKKATKTNPAITSGFESDITVKDGTLVTGSTFTTIGDFADINLQNSSMVLGKSKFNISGNQAMLNVEDSTVFKNSTINLNGYGAGAGFVNGTWGEKLTINAKGQDSSVLLNNSTIYNSKLKLTGLDGSFGMYNSVLDKSTLALTKGDTLAVYAEDSYIVNSKITASLGDIELNNNQIENSTITASKGDIYGNYLGLFTTGQKGTKATSLTASKGSLSLTNSIGQGTVNLTARGITLLVGSYAHLGNLNLTGGSETIIGIAANTDTDDNLSFTDGSTTYKFSRDVRRVYGGNQFENVVLGRLYFKDGTSIGGSAENLYDNLFMPTDDILPSLVTGNLKINGGWIAMVGNTCIMGKLDASSEQLALVNARVNGKVKIGGKSAQGGNRTAIYRSYLETNSKDYSIAQCIIDSYTYNFFNSNK